MSVSVEEKVCSPLSEDKCVFERAISKSSSRDSLDASANCSNTAVEAGPEAGNDKKTEASTPTVHPMSFTIDFGGGKQVDKSRLEELAKKSQARHQRVQSMSASFNRPSPTAQKPPMSAKLPRKAQGYNSEGYFSSDQEDSCLSGSAKLRQSPIAQTFEKTHITSPLINRRLKSPLHDSFLTKKVSKSPIVDSIMSRSDILPSRQGLNLPLKSPNSTYNRDVYRTPSFGNLSSSYQPKNTMADIIDQSPEGIMLTDISSPELDILTPDNGSSTPEPVRSPVCTTRRAVSEMPDLVFSKSMLTNETLYIDDDIDAQSDNSSTGTYTIEGDNYTEEQKARMSIDRTFSADKKDNTLKKRAPSNEKDPELIFDFPTSYKAGSKETLRDICLKSPLSNKTFEYPNKVSNDKNVLEISCCYESPTEDLAAQTSKQIKSTRSYLEKIKNRVKTITEKTFAKSPPKHITPADLGNFTSVTTSGVLSSKMPPKYESTRRRCSLTKSEIDQTDYIHRLTRESSVPVNLPSNALDGKKFESTVMKNAQICLRDDAPTENSEKIVGKLSNLSLNRCKGDKTWIQDWADSVKKYNYNELEKDVDVNSTFILDSEKPPISPRRDVQKNAARSSYSNGGTPTKIPSPVGTIRLSRRTPDLIPSTQDTEAYLQKTQNAITNLQAKLHSRNNSFSNIPPHMTSSLISDSKLPPSQLSRSNSLNYRLRKKVNSGDSSPLRSPGNYVITGSQKLPESTRILLAAASRSLDTDRKGSTDSNMNSPNSERGIQSNSSDDRTLSNYPPNDYKKSHSRHRSFDGRNAKDYFGDFSNANQSISLKNVLKNNAESHLPSRIDQTRYHGDPRHIHDATKNYNPLAAFGSTIKRSSSFNTVTKNNNYIDVNRRCTGQNDYTNYIDYGSDESEPSLQQKNKTSKARIESPDLKSIVPSNSPRCQNTPEMQRKFGTGLVRSSVRVTNKERALGSRLSEPPMGKEERGKANHQSRRISEPVRQPVGSRVANKSRSSTREVQPKHQDKASTLKKPAQYRSASTLPTSAPAGGGEVAAWRRRHNYDPMRSAREGRRKQTEAADLSHSSPVHRSQSFHTTNISELTLSYSSDEESTLPVDSMTVSTHSDCYDHRKGYRELRRDVLDDAREYINRQTERNKRVEAEKRKTYIVDDDLTPTRENVDFLKSEHTIDKRKTFILDSDTNSTTSPRNSSIFSQENKNSLTTCTSDTEGESGAESSPVVLRQPAKKSQAQPKQRHSGDYSMSSSTTSISQLNQSVNGKKAAIQPRYLDISKYKNESSPKNFLRRDPSKTYVGVLGNNPEKASKGSAKQVEMEQKKQELEKWKRRATYDPRKAAAQGKTATKTASNVLRSQSFHGPMLAPSVARYRPEPVAQITESYDASSDNDF